MAGARAFLPVVVDDDGSTDDTAAQAEAAGATVPVQRPNAGKPFSGWENRSGRPRPPPDPR